MPLKKLDLKKEMQILYFLLLHILYGEKKLYFIGKRKTSIILMFVLIGNLLVTCFVVQQGIAEQHGDLS